MRKRKLMISLLLLSLILSAFGGTVMARTVTRTKNNLEMGVVEISIQNSEADTGLIIPGQKIVLAPEILCEGCECYVRAKYEFSDYQDCFTSGDSGAPWVYNEADGYWYYTQILHPDESVTFFKDLTVSESLPQETSKKSIGMEIIAEAVQSRNVSPDFKSAAPWGTMEIESFEASRSYTMNRKAETVSGLSVEYEGKAEKLVTTPDDFFRDFPYLMPGDVRSRTITLANTYSEPMELYFYSHAEEDALLERIRLKIVSGSKDTVYEGNLLTKGLQGEENRVLLAKIPADSEGAMTFTIEVPAEMNNDYALLKSSVTWVFTTEKQEKPPANDPTPVPDNTPKNTPVNPPGKTGIPSVQTGDLNDLGFLFLTAGIALAIIVVCVFGLKDRRIRR